MSDFAALLSTHGSHRRRKKKRRRVEAQRGAAAAGAAGASAAAAAASAPPATAPMNLARAVAFLADGKRDAQRPDDDGALGVLVVALLVDEPNVFPHEAIWKRWLEACADSSPDSAGSDARRVRFVVAARERRASAAAKWPEWVRRHVIRNVATLPTTVARWGSVDELRLLLCLVQAATNVVDELDASTPSRIVLCDAGMLPASTDVDAFFLSQRARPPRTTGPPKTFATTLSSSRTGEGSSSSPSFPSSRLPSLSSTSSSNLPFSRSIQFDCVHGSVERARLRRQSPWGLVLSRDQASALLNVDSPAVRGATAPESWTALFQSVPCASEVYFATILSWLEDAGVVEMTVNKRTCCAEQWNRPVSRETDAICLGSVEAFAALVQQEVHAHGHLLFVRRVSQNLDMSVAQWEEACGVKSVSSSSVSNTVAADTAAEASPASAFPVTITSPSGRQQQQLVFPRGGRGQREAWFSDEYLLSVDPPACGAGNKFFIYTTYRLFALMHRKRLHFHDRRWLNPETFGLPLDVSFSVTDSNDSANALHRTPTNADRNLIVAVLRKTTMYLQWSPLILSWQRTVRPWFQTFVRRAVDAAKVTYGNSVCNDRFDTLTIHLRTGDIWEPRVRAANLANGGFVFYTQPPAWFYAWIVKRAMFMRGASKLRKAVVVTHVPNSTYTLAVVVALKSVLGLDAVQVCSGSLLADFGLLVRARQFVPSISTFAWWAAFLGNALFREDMAAGRVSEDSKRHVYLGLTGFWHPKSEHASRYNFGFDDASDCGCAQRHTFVLEKSDCWQNTAEQRAKAFAFDPPSWFLERYEN